MSLSESIVQNAHAVHFLLMKALNFKLTIRDVSESLKLDTELVSKELAFNPVDLYLPARDFVHSLSKNDDDRKKLTLAVDVLLNENREITEEFLNNYIVLCHNNRITVTLNQLHYLMFTAYSVKSKQYYFECFNSVFKNLAFTLEEILANFSNNKILVAFDLFYSIQSLLSHRRRKEIVVFMSNYLHDNIYDFTLNLLQKYSEMCTLQLSILPNEDLPSDEREKLHEILKILKSIKL